MKSENQRKTLFIHQGSVKVGELLIKSGAEVEYVDNSGQTPLHKATAHSN